MKRLKQKRKSPIGNNNVQPWLWGPQVLGLPPDLHLKRNWFWVVFQNLHLKRNWKWVVFKNLHLKRSWFWVVFNPICPSGGGCICVEKNLTFPNYKFGKGQYAFYPVSFAEKVKFVGNTRNSSWSEASSTSEKLKKSVISCGYSGHPNFVNTIEYGYLQNDSEP